MLNGKHFSGQKGNLKKAKMMFDRILTFVILQSHPLAVCCALNIKMMSSTIEKMSL